MATTTSKLLAAAAISSRRIGTSMMRLSAADWLNNSNISHTSSLAIIRNNNNNNNSCSGRRTFHSSSTCFQQESTKVDELFQKILHLDVVEVHILTELINQKMGLSMPDTSRDAAAAAGSSKQQQAAAEPAAEEKSVVDLKLTGFDAKAKIKVIKEVRAIAGLGLKEAKEVVEGAPKVIKKDLKPEEAEELKKKLEDVGATVEIS
jgi:large subunit ribosomal protein L7/L12